MKKADKEHINAINNAATYLLTMEGGGNGLSDRETEKHLKLGKLMIDNSELIATILLNIKK